MNHQVILSVTTVDWTIEAFLSFLRLFVLLSFVVMMFSLVIFMEIVALNDFDERNGIARIGGIACLFQSASPSFVVRETEIKEESIASTVF